MNGHDIFYVRVTKSDLLQLIKNDLSRLNSYYEKFNLETFHFNTDNPKVIYIN